MPRHRFTKSLPRLKESPYLDGSLGFKSFMWELYKEPISMTEDERLYSNGLVRLLEKEALLVERYSKHEREIQEDEDSYLFTGGYTLYLYKDNLIPIRDQDDGTVTVDCYYPTSRRCVIDQFKRFIIKEKGESKVSILVSRNGGLVAQKVSFAAPVISNLDLNYGTGFSKIHAKIMEKLEARNGKVFIFTGVPGGGKTTYIKYLTSIVNREAIFLPVNLTDRITSPDFISLLMTKKEAILILEDAEQAVQQRGTGNDDSVVANLLNMADGILGTILNISLLITTNSDVKTFDRAVMRKGRLGILHDFGPLKKEDASKLMKSLGKQDEVKGPMTLAEIYGVGDDVGQPIPQEAGRQMGFHTAMAIPTPKAEPVKEKESGP